MRRLNICVFITEINPEYGMYIRTMVAQWLEIGLRSYLKSGYATSSKYRSEATKEPPKGFDIEYFNAMELNLPATEQLAGFDGVVIPGSASSATDNDEWICNLETKIVEIVTLRVPLLGLCFGHQIVAHALGGKVIKNPFGRLVGLRSCTVVDNNVKKLLRGGGDKSEKLELKKDKKSSRSISRSRSPNKDHMSPTKDSASPLGSSRRSSRQDSRSPRARSRTPRQDFKTPDVPRQDHISETNTDVLSATTGSLANLFGTASSLNRAKKEKDKDKARTKDRSASKPSSSSSSSTLSFQYVHQDIVMQLPPAGGTLSLPQPLNLGFSNMCPVHGMIIGAPMPFVVTVQGHPELSTPEGRISMMRLILKHAEELGGLSPAAAQEELDNLSAATDMKLIGALTFAMFLQGRGTAPSFVETAAGIAV
eukprot:Selendium_serpulae@DN5826_c0_g1_i1.p1